MTAPSTTIATSPNLLSLFTLSVNTTPSESIDVTTSTVAAQGTCNISRTATAERIIYAVFLFIIMMTSLAGNLLVVLSISMSNSLKRRVTFYFIGSLACSDFFLAMFQLPFKMSTKLYGDYFCHHVAACFFYIIIDAFCNTSSILHLLLIALDRFIAVKFPYRHCEIFSTENSKRAIASIWVLSGFWTLAGLFNWRENGKGTFGIYINRICYNTNEDYYAASSFGLYLSVLVVITCTYITILHVALSQIKAIEATQVSVLDRARPSLLTINNDNPSCGETVCKKRKRTLRKELKATKSVAIVYLAYVVCWLPCYIINIIIYVDNKHFPALNKTDRTLFLFLYYTFIEMLPAINTTVNPFIYSFSNQQFRAASKLLLSKIFRIKQFQQQRERLNTSMYEFNSSCPVSPAIPRTANRLQSLDGLWRPV